MTGLTSVISASQRMFIRRIRGRLFKKQVRSSAFVMDEGYSLVSGNYACFYLIFLACLA